LHPLKLSFWIKTIKLKLSIISARALFNLIRLGSTEGTQTNLPRVMEILLGVHSISHPLRGVKMYTCRRITNFVSLPHQISLPATQLCLFLPKVCYFFWQIFLCLKNLMLSLVTSLLLFINSCLC
jgi:hypothetical protein